MYGVVLDKLDIENDAEILYRIMTSEEQCLFSTKLNLCTKDAFLKWFLNRLGRDFHDFLMVRLTSNGETAGYVHNYDFSLTHQTCKLVVYILPAFQNTGLGGMAAVLFLKTLFEKYPLRKVYSTVYSYNQKSLENNRRAGFLEEGVLLDYRYYDGTFHNLHYFSVTREYFEKNFRKLVRSCSA